MWEWRTRISKSQQTLLYSSARFTIRLCQIIFWYPLNKKNRGGRQVSHTYHWIGPVIIVLIVFITDRFCPMTSQYWSGYIMSGTVVTLPLSPLTMALNLPSSQLIKLYLPSWLLTFKQTNCHKALSSEQKLWSYVKFYLLKASALMSPVANEYPLVFQ